MPRRPAVFFVLLFSVSLASAQTASQPTAVSEGVITGLLAHRVNPIYPPLARQARIQGAVVLHVIITKSGDVKNVQLISGHPMLAPAAIAAVKQWKYQPYSADGEPVEVETNIQVIFRLAGEPAATGADSPVEVGGNVPCSAAFRDSVGGIVSAIPPAAPNDGSSSGRANIIPPPRVRVSEKVMRSRRTEKVNPAYPPLAVTEHIEGSVALNVCVTNAGNVGKVELISGHPMLASAAMEAVLQWKYKPYLLNGQPVEVETLVRLNFTVPPGQESEGVVNEQPVPDTPPYDTQPRAPASQRMPLTPAEHGPPRLAAPERVRVSSGVAQELLVSKVAPDYPPLAQQARIQGTVILRVIITKSGDVESVELVSGHPLLAPAAMEAVKQWKYQPCVLNGTPVEVETQVIVDFSLSPG
jgi:TonB family protein